MEFGLSSTIRETRTAAVTNLLPIGMIRGKRGKCQGEKAGETIVLSF
jgi:hypothetical protein